MLLRSHAIVLGVISILSVIGAIVRAAEVPLIPRTTILGNPERISPQISPDGKRMGFVAPLKGVLNVWVAPVGDLKVAKPVTKDTGRGIRQYFWAFDNKHLLYLQDEGGNENDHLYRVNPDTGDVTDLTPVKGIKVRIDGASYRKPNEILVGINDRNPQLHDTYRIDLETGKRELVYKNSQYVAVITDDDLNVRLGFAFGVDFKARINRIEPDGKSETIMTMASVDAMSTQPLGFDKTGQSIFVLDSRDRDKVALTRVDLSTLKTTELYEGKRADISAALVHPTEKTVLAVSENYDRSRWSVLDPGYKQDFEALLKLPDGDFNIVSQSLDNRIWVVSLSRDTDGLSYYLYDRNTHKPKFLFSARPELKKYKLASMRPVIIKSRDGLELVSYLTLPVGTSPKPVKPLPMVLFVHGGPWARDNWGYSTIHQLLANRGYAVMSVNYRGSTGFGKSFVSAANRQWATRMHEDLLDTVDWAIKEGIADPKRVAIGGGSYGGYATLVGLTFTPDKFACGVDIVGPSNLVTLMKNMPPYWMPLMPVMKQRVGDASTEEGRNFLLSRSPISRVDQIKRPLMIGQGANDPRVNKVEAEQIVKAMKDRGLPVTYLLYPDEGHGFARPENNLSFFAVAEGFLAKYLGGRYEPIDTAFKGSSIQVMEDGGDLSGLKEAAGAVSGHK